MPKSIFQDIVPKKSIRDIPLPNRRGANEFNDEIIEKKPAHKAVHHHSEESSHEHVHENIHEQKHEIVEESYADITDDDYTDGHFEKVGRNGRKIWVWVAGFVAVVIVGVLVASFFQKATLNISLKTDDIAVNGLFVAKPADVSTSGTSTAIAGASSGTLTYQVLTLPVKQSQTVVPGTGTQNVSKKASGKIIVYNNYSSAAQKLVANTRFESPDGKIYRISSSITVPGKTTSGGKSVAGSVEATVTADEPGVAYNTDSGSVTGGLVDFTIPGFKGDPRYCATPSDTCVGFYARAKTPMTGGYVGVTKIVSQADINAAIVTLDSSLRESLVKQAMSQVPADFIMYPTAYSISFATASSTPGPEGTTVVEQATLSAFLLNRNELTESIGSISGYTAKNLESLSFAFSTTTQGAFDPKKEKNVAFSLAGTAHLVATVDKAALLKASLGLPKTSISSLLISFPGVEAIDVSLFPFWKNSVPNDPDNVDILVKESESKAK